jgi:superfamily II DNA/RNA helicase
MRLPTRVEVARQGTVAEKVDQQLYVVNREAKPALLDKLLHAYGGSVLLFVRTKHNARKITKNLRDMSHNAAEIHSNRSLNQRREALEGFKSGKYRILVATDIAARGIDVTGIELVINYDLPDDENNYIHRIGRTGRAGQAGRAVSFAAPDQSQEVRSIEKLIRMPLPIAVHPDMPQARFAAPAPKPQSPARRQNSSRRPQPAAGYQRPPSAPGRAHKAFIGHEAPRPGGQQGRGGPRRDRKFGPGPSGAGRGRVSSSAYFEGEAPASGGRRDHSRGYSRSPRRESEHKPAAETKRPSAGTGWFSRFIKVKKDR